MRVALFFMAMFLAASTNAQKIGTRYSLEVGYGLAKAKDSTVYLVLTQPLFVRYSNIDSALTDIKNRLAVLARDSADISHQAAQLRKIKGQIEKQ